MKRIILSLPLVFLLWTPSYAFLDAIASSYQAAQEAVYEKFMMAKTVEELKSLRDNYVASMRYYAYFKELNEGKGIVYNAANQIADIGDQTYQQAQMQFKNDWIYDPGGGSSLDAVMNNLDAYASTQVLYAGKVFQKSVLAQKEGEQLAAQSDTLTSLPQKLSVKSQALQIQLIAQTNANLAQLLEVNTRLYEIEMEHEKERWQEWDLFQKSVEKMTAQAMTENGASSEAP